MPRAGGFLAIALLLPLIFCPGIVSAWGSIAHAYLVNRALGGNAAPLALYGATAPDIFETTIALPAYSTLSREMHMHPLKMVMWSGPNQGVGPFVLGFISHNEVRGADFYAHRRGVTTRAGYVITKAAVLKGTVRAALESMLARAGVPFPSLVASNFAEDVAHPLVETAIDVLLHYRHDDGIARYLGYGAATRSSAAPELLVKAFALSIGEKTGLDRETVSALLLSSEKQFRQSIIDYVGALGPDESQAIASLAAIGAQIANAVAIDKIGQDIGIAADDLVPLLYAAMDEVEADYLSELDQVAARLTRYLKTWRIMLER